MSAKKISANEIVLAEGACLNLRRFSWAGHMQITNQRVLFQPNKLIMMFGVKAWSLPLGAIKKVEMVGRNTTMHITTEKEVIRIAGKDVNLLFARLFSIAVEHDKSQLEHTYFEPGERVILRSDESLIINMLVWIRGDLLLTNRRIRYEPRSRLEKWLFKKHSLDIPLSTIRNVKLDVVRKRLEFTFQNQTKTLAGSGVIRLYSYITCIARDGGADGILGCWSAQLHRGALAQRGDLMLSNKRALFVSAGAVEAMMGTREELDLNVSDINRLQVEGTVDARLVIQVGKKTHMFSVANPRDRVNELVPVLLQTNGPDDPAPTGPNVEIDKSRAAEMLQPWLEQLNIEKDEIKLAGPAVHISNRPAARRGWVLLRSEHAIFIPGGSKSYSSRPVVLSTLSLVAPLDDARGSQLRLTGDGASVRLIPRGGNAFVTKFWDIWQTDRDKVMADARQKKRAQKQAMKERLVAQADGGNRRESYRVVFPNPRLTQILINRDARVLPPRRLNCLAVDLSEGGIGIVSNVDRDIDSEFILLMDSGMLAIPLVAKIVHSKKMKKSTYRWGVEFLDVELDLTLRLRAVVMQTQREVLQERFESDSV